MSNLKCEEALDVHAKNASYQNFVQKVRDEDHYCQIVDWALLQSTGENPYRKSVESNSSLAEAVKQEDRQRFVQDRRRQQLRQNNHELREFESQIRAAYIRKTMAVQTFEREAIKNRDMARNHERKKLLMAGRMQLEEAAQRAEEENRVKKEAHKQDLLEQMAETNLKRQKAYEKLMQDKREMDAQTERYMKMEEKESLEAAEKRARTKREMEEFLRSKEEWKLLQTDTSLKEQEKLNELTRQRELQAEQAKKEKKERQLRREEWTQKMGREIHDAAMEKIKARDTLAELLIDERQAKEDEHARHELERQKQYRSETCRQLKRDIEEKEYRKENQQKMDREIYEEQMRLLAERDKIDQLSDEKRRKKQLEHRRDLLEFFVEKKRLKSKNMLDEFSKRNEMLRAKEKLENEVEEERIRMIMELGPGIMDYLPRGAIRKSDYKFLSVPPKQN